MMQLTERGALLTRVLEDGRAIDLWPQLFNWKLTISASLEDGGWIDAWEYPTLASAVQAYAEWTPLTEPEPSGWYRNPPTGRRRPDGDPAKEYVQL